MRLPEHSNIVLVSLELLPEYNYNLATASLKAQVLADPFLSERNEVICLSFEKPWSIGEIALEVAFFRPAIVGFSCYVWNLIAVEQLTCILKQLIPQTILVTGGPEMLATSAQLNQRLPLVNFFIRGEGEVTFVKLLHALAMNASDTLANIPGLLWRQPGGTVLDNGLPLNVNELTTISSPFLEKMSKELPEKLEKVCIETTRGCAFNCSFCCYSKGNNQVRHFPLFRILEELRLLASRGADEIYLMDPTFNLHKDRAKTILREIISWDQQVKLHLEIRAELLDQELVNLLSQLNVPHLEIGLQSTSNSTTNGINRRNNLRTFRQGMNWLREANITTELHLIAGLPLDTVEMFWQSVDDAISFSPDHISVFRLMLLPGTLLYKEAEILGLTFQSTPPYHILDTPTINDSELDGLLLESEKIQRIWPFVRFCLHKTDKNFCLSKVDLLRKLASYEDRPMQCSNEELIQVWSPLLVENADDKKKLRANLIFGRAFQKADFQNEAALPAALKAMGTSLSDCLMKGHSNEQG